MQELVAMIVRGLVDQPEVVAVERVEEEHSVVYEVQVAADDLGKVIGKQGRTARAIRVILGAASANLGKHSVLEIIE